MMSKNKKERLDIALVRRGLASGAKESRALIMSGKVRVKEKILDKPGTAVSEDSEITLILPERKYVSRAGEKLEAALNHFKLCPKELITADVGASTGGFTEVLLSKGASRVYAIDVAYGEIAWKLREDPRVVLMERTNARHLKSLTEPVDLVTIDVSFISLKLIIPNAVNWLKPGGILIALIKPQFEADSKDIPPGGVVTDPSLHKAIIDDIECFAAALKLRHKGTIASPLKGISGNQEFLACWELPALEVVAG
jgi:23S rRNA (cytidine1920-2'-O)/16S rRNA (cytidine1409-2'-O)-methyltransferase